MTTKWCPECGSEYVEGVTECGECGVALVDTQPELEPERGPSVRDLDGQFGPDDNVVELCSIPSEFQAELIGAQLREMGIPTTVLSPGLGIVRPVNSLGGSRLYVRSDDVERAAAVVNEAYTQTPLNAPFDETELSQLAEESAEPEGWVDPNTGAAI